MHNLPIALRSGSQSLASPGWPKVITEAHFIGAVVGDLDFLPGLFGAVKITLAAEGVFAFVAVPPRSGKSHLSDNKTYRRFFSRVSVWQPEPAVRGNVSVTDKRRQAAERERDGTQWTNLHKLGSQAHEAWDTACARRAPRRMIMDGKILHHCSCCKNA